MASQHNHTKFHRERRREKKESGNIQAKASVGQATEPQVATDSTVRAAGGLIRSGTTFNLYKYCGSG